MATSNSDCCNSVRNKEPAATHLPEQITQPAEPDYDLVEQPDKDLYCPVTLEILVEPHQTDCCGQHLSEKAAQRIIRDGKPCPMCNNAPFKTLKDKFFKRNTINKLNVRCPHKKSGCEWTGELGDLNHHTTSCPWKCQYCDFKSTHDIGTNDHTPCCDNYPLPCPNKCEIGTVPHCQTDSHMLECPLQLVECKFAGAGCDVKVPRRDLVGHMTESVQHHLLTATLLNLQLTRELHQKMEEKDQQIVDLQKQVKQVKEQGNAIDTKIQQLDAKVDTKFQQQDENINTKLNDLHTKVATNLENHDAKVDTKFQDLDVKVEQQARNLDTKVSDLKVTMEAANTVKIQMLNGFSCHEFTLTEFTKQRKKPRHGLWSGGEFTTKGWNFTFCVCTTGARSAHKTHLSPYIDKLHFAGKTEGVAILHMLNQLGGHGHYIGTETNILKERGTIYFGDSSKFFSLDRLGYCADTNTQYRLKDDCLKFRLFMKVKAL